MKQALSILVLLLALSASGQTTTNCMINDLVAKENIDDMLRALESLNDSIHFFEDDPTFNLKYWCFLQIEMTDTVLTLHVDSVVVSGGKNLKTYNWEPRFKAHLTSIVEQFALYMPGSAIRNKNCLNFVINGAFRRCL